MNTADLKSNTILKNLRYKRPNLSLRKVISLAGSLRKSVGAKMLKRIQASRRNDW